HWVDDLSVSEDGTHAVFHCKYSIMPNVPELAIIGSAVEDEETGEITYTQFFELELTEDGYAVSRG
ncbi:MAG: hypothetical protein IJC35_03820, partial [Oscillospiraceae bacterium]|nr:hypothetical protein [Oscillospiraceae bacterium]